MKALLANVLFGLLSGCSENRPPVLFGDGPVELATRELLISAVEIRLIVVIPVCVLTALVIWRYRANSPKGHYNPDWDFSWPIDIVAWSVPVAIVATLGFQVWTKTHQLDPYRVIAAPDHPLVIEVVALDWKWLFIYPEQNIASVNRLVFPAGRDVTLKITSDTVMNVFSVPALGGQIYAMAGIQTQLNLVADAPGTFAGHNTQFSGKGFPQDRFTAEAMTPQNFENFIANAQTSCDQLDAQTCGTLAQPTIESNRACLHP